MEQTIVVLEGDQTGQELLEQALRLFDPGLTGLPLQLLRFNLSLDNRRATANEVVYQAAEAMKKFKLGLKAATITPKGTDDVGSPNAILRQIINGQIILRTGLPIPGIPPLGGSRGPIAVVRMAVDDAYNAKEWREAVGGDVIAHRTETISLSTCKVVAEFAFRQAKLMGATLIGASKFTVSRLYESLLNETLAQVAEKHPQVVYQPMLIDALYASLMTPNPASLVIATLNRDGDCLSDMVLPIFGSIASAESLVISFDAQDATLTPRVIMAEAPHGTVPKLQGKNLANPMATILAAGALLGYVEDSEFVRVSQAIRNAVTTVLKAGIKTVDLGGHATTSEFTDAVIAKVQRWLST